MTRWPGAGAGDVPAAPEAEGGSGAAPGKPGPAGKGAMARPGDRILFVERQTYRRRRLMDAARVLPVLGLALYLVPLLWGHSGQEPVRMSQALLYIFAVWAGLWILAALMAGPLSRPGGTNGTGQNGGPGGPEAAPPPEEQAPWPR